MRLRVLLSISALAVVVPGAIVAQTSSPVFQQSAALFGIGWVEDPAAPESLVTVTSPTGGLANTSVSGDLRSPTTTLGGTSVTVKDSAGIERPALLYYVSPEQINYVVPAGMAVGDAVVTFKSGDGTSLTATLKIQQVSPGIFYRSFDYELPAGHVVRVRNGAQTIEPLHRIDHSPMPIDMGPETDEVFLVLFGTGLRGRSSLDNVKLSVWLLDGTRVELPVRYAGPQSEFPGLDQLNALIPRSVLGHKSPMALGSNWLGLSVDGKTGSYNEMVLYLK